ncbi:circadian clock KaiB family protein [Burkholderia sp. S171]|uniref:circadian clock KaiB family protein n=1 Tax=Burkholderia sp. S171 TaxID=1641860 RepID=UPI00131C6E2C|nr:circadian clock KaiB family protein [Burkholderia sp. S171]
MTEHDSPSPAQFEPDAAGTPGACLYSLRLYIAGETPKSLAAIRNLRALCAMHLAGEYSIEVIDLRVNPQLAAADQILAIPTVVRHLPAPLRKVIGDLSDTERVLVGLDIQTRAGS